MILSISLVKPERNCNGDYMYTTKPVTRASSLGKLGFRVEALESPTRFRDRSRRLQTPKITN